jgi:hypothetical protein
MGDFNGDGKTDFLRQEKGDLASQPDWMFETFISNGDGSFNTQFVMHEHSMHGDFTNLFVGDFDGNGSDDFLLQEKGHFADDIYGMLQSYTSYGNGSFTKRWQADEYAMHGDLTNLFTNNAKRRPIVKHQTPPPPSSPTTDPGYEYKDADYLNALYQDNVANGFSRKVHGSTSAFDSDDSAPDGDDFDNRVYALVGGEVIEAKNGKEVSSKKWGYNGTIAIYNKDLNKTFIYWHFAEGSIDENLQGKTVAAGSLIGIEGNTGSSYGNHTHLEVHEGRANVDMSNPNNPKSPANSGRLNVGVIFQEAVRRGLVKLYK